MPTIVPLGRRTSDPAGQVLPAGQALGRSEPSSEIIDEAVLAKVKNGEPAACVDLVRRHQAKVFALLGRMLRPRGLEHQIEDLAQETFLRVFRSLATDGFDPRGPAKLSTWILCISSRLAINAIKTAAKKPSIALPADFESKIGVAPDQERVDAEQALCRAIERLSPNQQAALVLRVDDVEIGEVLGLGPGAVRARIFRARAQLRKQMGQEVI